MISANHTKNASTGLPELRSNTPRSSFFVVNPQRTIYWGWSRICT